jgi:hypothetical protein
LSRIRASVECHAALQEQTYLKQMADARNDSAGERTCK